MYFTYILRSDIDGSYYTGVTKNLDKRIAEHNNGLAKYSSTKKPFTLAWCCNFADKKRAYDFEKYLKSGSGIAFRNKHLI